MKSRKQIIAALLVLIMILSFTACGNNNIDGSSGETRTVTDYAGRKVTIPKDPKRVVCIYSSAAHMMAMLDEQDKIVGVPNGVKSDELMKLKINNLEDISVPSQDNDINVEELMNLDADIILVKADTISSKGQKEKLEKIGVPYVVIDYTNIDQLQSSITLMGKIFNEGDKAKKYNDFMNETIDIVNKKLTGVADSQKPKVYHSVNEAIRTDENGGICEEILQKAGVVPVTKNQELAKEKNKTYATIEEIYNWDPQGIVANEYSVTDYILSDSKWSGLTAVKNKSVYTLPVGATRWCHPGSMEAHMGVLSIAWRFYPEKFKDFDINKYVKDYYKEFFGLKLDNKTVKNILAGKGMRKSNEAEQND